MTDEVRALDRVRLDQRTGLPAEKAETLHHLSDAESAVMVRTWLTGAYDLLLDAWHVCQRVESCQHITTAMEAVVNAGTTFNQFEPQEMRP